MRFDLVTLFPELFGPLLTTSLLGRAIEADRVQIRTKSPREFGVGRHKKVDDTPYGGGSGMVMRADCLVDCMEALDADAPNDARGYRVLLTPQGQPLRQHHLMALAKMPAVMLVCGRYEGFDDRVSEFVNAEISLGDFVLAGGEIAAMAIIEGVARLLPGVLGNEASPLEESHSPAGGGLLEYPQYTRPPEFRGHRVPEVLVGGNHAEIARWRTDQARARTARRRPDLLTQLETSATPASVGREDARCVPTNSNSEEQR